MFIIQSTIDRKTSWAKVGKQCTTLPKQMCECAVCVGAYDLRMPFGFIYLSARKVGAAGPWQCS